MLSCKAATYCCICTPAEKNLDALRCVMEAVPGCRLALVGDGPARPQLEQHLAGLPVTFMVRAC